MLSKRILSLIKGIDTTPVQFTMDYVMAAGGGAGGARYYGGGGGAGGYLSSFGLSGANTAQEASSTTLSYTTYNIVIGAGGSLGTSGTTSYMVGSGFNTISSSGGGYGAGGTVVITYPASGGSGGGGDDYGSPVNGAAGIAGEGMAGGNSGYAAAYRYAGGGGGASEAGQGSGSTHILAGKGGDGQVSLITGSALYHAGGGGGASNAHTNYLGGLGGNGGGGQGSIYGSSTPPMSAGAANTGSGGGGGTHGHGSVIGQGAAGGSGFFILRYPASYTLVLGTATAPTHLNTTVNGNTGFKYSKIESTGTISFT